MKAADPLNSGAGVVPKPVSSPTAASIVSSPVNAMFSAVRGVAGVVGYAGGAVASVATGGM